MWNICISFLVCTRIWRSALFVRRRAKSSISVIQSSINVTWLAASREILCSHCPCWTEARHTGLLDLAAFFVARTKIELFQFFLWTLRESLWCVVVPVKRMESNFVRFLQRRKSEKVSKLHTSLDYLWVRFLIDLHGFWGQKGQSRGACRHAAHGAFPSNDCEVEKAPLRVCQFDSLVTFERREKKVTASQLPCVRRSAATWQFILFGTSWEKKPVNAQAKAWVQKLNTQFVWMKGLCHQKSCSSVLQIFCKQQRPL